MYVEKNWGCCTHTNTHTHTKYSGFLLSFIQNNDSRSNKILRVNINKLINIFTRRDKLGMLQLRSVCARAAVSHNNDTVCSCCAIFAFCAGMIRLDTSPLPFSLSSFPRPVHCRARTRNKKSYTPGFLSLPGTLPFATIGPLHYVISATCSLEGNENERKEKKKNVAASGSMQTSEVGRLPKVSSSSKSWETLLSRRGSQSGSSTLKTFQRSSFVKNLCVQNLSSSRLSYISSLLY